MTEILSGRQHEVSEWSYHSVKTYADPFNTVEVDALVHGPTGSTWRVPAFWAGGQEWRARFTPPEPGRYRLLAACTDAANLDLNGVERWLEVGPARDANPLMAHGPLRVATSRRTLEHRDGTPFFWLGDTWWMGFCQRMKWPQDFQSLTADRVAKGFSVIQIVAGLYPDMPGFDPRGLNEAGFPWEAEYARINPAYFDMADHRIAWLVQSGFVPCIVGCWGYYLPLLGIPKMKQHWRNIVARWGAYPVVWCLAGEAAMPYYLSTTKEEDQVIQISGWTEMGRYLRQIDPFHHPVTIHPTQVGRDQVNDDSVLDINMLQTGHGGQGSLVNTVTVVAHEYPRQPVMPVLVDEVSYEGFMHTTSDEVQRLVFWSSILSGMAGHTYGANGIWQVNTREAPYGPSPHGATWGDRPWDEASQLPGSAQLGLAKQLLMRYEWWHFEPHPEWVDPASTPEHIEWPLAAGIPGKVRVIYFYGPNFPWERPYLVQNLETDLVYKAFFWDPRTAKEHPLGKISPGEDGSWVIPPQPELTDWVLVIETLGTVE